jgi:hypothetical protein
LDCSWRGRLSRVGLNPGAPGDARAMDPIVANQSSAHPD